MRSLENLQMAKRASKIKVRCRQTPVYQEFFVGFTSCNPFIPTNNS
ncbi:hypothetical protein B4417_2488 [Bacillus subtilis]|nr:hypothetical protein ABU16_1619 [Bacillus subtilis]KZD80027.1 hypothetical protein B4417_2488 [Bacillus subtilis]